MTLLLARLEWKRLFAQPLAWALLAVLLALLAYFFLLSLDAYLRLMPKIAGTPAAPGVTDLIALPLMRAAASVLLLIAPLVGMRAIASERQTGTFALLAASGIGDGALVRGKWLGALALLALLVLLAVAMPLSLEIGTTLDLGRLAAATLGLLLFAAALSAIAVAASAYAEQPIVAAVVALALNLLLWMADAGARYEGVNSGFINYLALPTHLEPFLHGMVASVDVIYFLLLVLLALTFAARRLATARRRA
jgi:ABC-2 type transport system permease protein